MSATTDAQARPRQTTVALSLVVGAGLIALLTAWETMAGIDSIDTRESLEKLLSESPWNNTGLSVAGLRDAYRVSALVAGAGGVAAAILAGFAFKGDRSHRLALSFVAVPVTIAGFVAGGLSTVLVGAATMMLWLQPSRAWFNGDPIPDMTRRPGTGAQQRADGDPRTSTPEGPGWAAPDPGARLSGPGRAPLSVMRAAILTGVFATGTLLVLLAVLLVLATTPDTLMEDVRRQEPALFERGVTEQQMVVTLIVLLALLVVWCVAALVFAIHVVRGREWARVALIVSAGAAGLAFALSSIANPLMLFGVLACVFTTLQLARPESVAFTRHR